MNKIKLMHYYAYEGALENSDFESYLEQRDIYNVEIFYNYFVDENAEKIYVLDDDCKLILAPKHDYEGYLRALKNCCCFDANTKESLDDDVFEVIEVLAEYTFGGLYLEGHEFDTESKDTHFGYYEDEYIREHISDLKYDLKK